MRRNIQLIEKIIKELEQKELLEQITDANVFYDEPQWYFYNISLKSSNIFPDPDEYNICKQKIIASGISVKSGYLALLKCLSEGIEHFSLYHIKKNSLINSSYSQLNQPALDPAEYTNNTDHRKSQIGWVRGFNLTKNEICFIPAQLIFIDYVQSTQEPKLSVNISTGAAGGFDFESSLLRGIYEVIERDSILTLYLNDIKFSKVETGSLGNNKIRAILEYCKQYKIGIHIYNTTNDLGIPAFLSVLDDKTGQGPQFTVGAKANLNWIEAVIGSIEEAFLSRPWMRWEMLKRRFKLPKIKPELINTVIDRTVFWNSPETKIIRELLINQSPTPYKPVLSVNSLMSFNNKQKELSYILNILKSKGFTVYMADISLDNFKKLGHCVYKIIIPKLQPLYLSEKQKVFRMNRLRTVARYFGKDNFVINSFPHPFL